MRKLLNPVEIKNSYPKAYAKLEEWVKQDYNDSALPKEIKEAFTLDNLVTGALTAGYRSLWGFFDENEIYLFVARDGDSFGYGIGPSKNGMMANGFDERMEAEIEGFFIAFNLLEKTL